ncbi:bifunctional D-glycero-beta-D-manno-heptose-7-phosphate kinase/D-glycero-beta-D-manno-heptose 1-phosphate adenylyltransferase HldE [Sediminicurvatus halobius]|uniref:Bifunctional protein HldE n=1 Tax=Sediminicurvatus halobius TaxID=2182432 RepID=A0A2U2N744_9GAMM|nr:bifunctional D-glycero-beta-D-manno-heptose-7-phosphate kinase/D-glycero-beta-D-manno-heptose 1-phosphate adenylyltransferase HldE [Spiribacter halobius]PWG64897.1 bifunctional heptose 7-phosphate kinase/heptose 1-phosphate adenyltransferase [Spiribacter halobius]UEX78248.1 bifunctional D-glycero-beta-D-manno-heptose-7-phosphate kinase/D-glycero-beta-D-manno-heptose 1-phosphate adenylyltransferase HldE [Spiribacter halobius]
MRIPEFSQAEVLVAGDVMLDRYWHGSTGRISPEAPVPVVRIGGREDRPGGAANVALGLSALGARARLLAPVGRDEAADVLDRLLDAAGVTRHWRRHEGMATTSKLRVLSQHQQMIRLDFEDPPEPGWPLTADDLAAALGDSGVAAVVLSDYAKGALAEPAALIAAAQARGVPVLVDPKRPDFEAYRGASVLTPNRGEFERVAGPCPDAETLVRRAQALLSAHDLGALVITRGEEGMTVVARGEDAIHVAAQARDVFDVTGAGDTVIAVLAGALAAGEDLGHAAALANLAAGVAVGKLGTATVSPTELHRAAAAWQPTVERGVTDPERLPTAVRNLQRQGERVVMTNGCFDLLHPGHVAYLEQARALGDRLVVAVNDDASVSRLKGESRPVVPLADRMAVLAGLASVDWVVPFSEDTPAALIEAIAPDILVKGGDYRVEQIAGHESVLSRGGEVRVLPFRAGYSTTGILKRLRGGSTAPDG